MSATIYVWILNFYLNAMQNNAVWVKKEKPTVHAPTTLPNMNTDFSTMTLI